MICAVSAAGRVRLLCRRHIRRIIKMINEETKFDYANQKFAIVLIA